jgi:hypothetical protein
MQIENVKYKKIVKSKYPFHFMEVGQSIFCEKSEAKKVAMAAYYHAKEYNKKFLTQSEDGGLRVYRVE